ncbi:MAG: hypothetical protein GX882_09810 [Methanomicrobiales archaeon]|nr:hypothetical protein [Methanomicrobiales archaeon]
MPGPDKAEEFSRAIPSEAGNGIAVVNRNGGVNVSVWEEDRIAVTAVKRTVYGLVELAKVRIETMHTGMNVRAERGLHDTAAAGRHTAVGREFERSDQTLGGARRSPSPPQTGISSSRGSDRRAQPLCPADRRVPEKGADDDGRRLFR